MATKISKYIYNIKKSTTATTTTRKEHFIVMQSVYFFGIFSILSHGNYSLMNYTTLKKVLSSINVQKLPFCTTNVQIS